MVCRFSGRVISLSEEQSLKALSPIVITFLDTVTEFNEVQSSNASHAITLAPW